MIISNELRRLLRRRKIESFSITLLATLAAVGIVGRSASDNPVARASAAAVAPPTEEQIHGASEEPGWDLPNLDHPRVDSWIERFTSDQRRSFSIFLDRKQRYEEMITSKLAEREMPQELVYLAMIESGFNPTATSRVKAQGLWQFMAPTGRSYGLTVNGRVDERNNPEKATEAALTYLSDLYRRFGSWYLAAAAYNTGQGRVASIMRSTTGSVKGTDEDFYRIASRLPRETREYVPKLIAAARIGKEPEKYGFQGTLRRADQ
jgi:membrane-bound lytic murein transglycosylase D